MKEPRRPGGFFCSGIASVSEPAGSCPDKLPCESSEPPSGAPMPARCGCSCAAAKLANKRLAASVVRTAGRPEKCSVTGVRRNPIFASICHFAILSQLELRPSRHAKAARFQRPLPLVPVPKYFPALIQVVGVACRRIEIRQLSCPTGKETHCRFCQYPHTDPVNRLCSSSTSDFGRICCPRALDRKVATYELLVRRPH